MLRQETFDKADIRSTVKDQLFLHATTDFKRRAWSGCVNAFKNSLGTRKPKHCVKIVNEILDAYEDLN